MYDSTEGSLKIVSAGKTSEPCTGVFSREGCSISVELKFVEVGYSAGKHICNVTHGFLFWVLKASKMQQQTTKHMICVPNGS